VKLTACSGVVLENLIVAQLFKKFPVFWAVPWLRRLVAGFLPRRPGFAPRAAYVGFMMDKVALGQVFIGVLQFSPVGIIPPLLQIHSCSIWELDNGPVRGRISIETVSPLNNNNKIIIIIIIIPRLLQNA
jgi:hypothetical protein